MSDRIIVSDLLLYAYHGVHPEEQRLGQRFEVDLSCRLDLRPAGLDDSASSTVSYASLVEVALKVARERTFFLIEAFAEAIAAGILADYPQIEEITVTVRKPSAPIPAAFAHVAVEITRGR